jgi:hypothetical protein
VTTDQINIAPASLPQEVLVLPSAARTAAPNVQQFVFGSNIADGPRGLVLVIDVTALTATGTLTVKVEGVDPISAKAYTLLQSVSITATGTTVLRIYPGLTAAANTVASDVLPAVWQVTATPGNSVSITYSIAGSLLA